MRLLAINCGHCGAPLEVPPKTRYVTCGYCSTRLEVHRSGGAVFTEVVEALAARTESIAEDVELLKLRRQLEELDRKWMADREEYMIRGQHGEMRVPQRISLEYGMVGALFALAAFSALLAAGAGGTAAFLSVVIGIPLAIACLWSVSERNKKAAEYAQRHRQYKQQREAICEQVHERS